MKRLATVVAVACGLIAWTSRQPAYGNEEGCSIVSCDELVVSCTSVDISHNGNEAGQGGGEVKCKEAIFAAPCTELTECALVLARRQVPALGGAVLGFAATMLAAGGAVGLRRKRPRRS